MTVSFSIDKSTENKIKQAEAFLEKYNITTKKELQEVVDEILNISMLKISGIEIGGE